MKMTAKKELQQAPPVRDELTVIEPAPLRDAQDFMAVLGRMIQTTAAIANDIDTDKRERIVAAKVAGDLCMGAIRTAELAHDLIAKERRTAEDGLSVQSLFDYQGRPRGEAFQPVAYAEAAQVLTRHARRAGLEVENAAKRV